CLAAFESRHDYFRLAAQTSYAQILFLIPYRAEHVDERRRLAEIAEAAWARVAGVLGTAPPLEVTQFPALLLDGFWERARVGATAARGVHVIWRHIADSVLVTLMAYRGEGDAADPLIQELLPEGPATEPGNCLFLSGSHLQRLAAKLALDAHDLPMARAWLEAHDRWLEWSGAVLGQADGQLGWAAYHHAGGDRDASRRHAEQALALATDPRQPLALIAVHRFLGQLDSEERRYADAEAHLQQSLALADACAAPFERALTLLELAGLRAVQDKPDEARALLQEIRAICEPLGAKPTLERVAALEQQLVGGGR
ncbi:MAG TPA: hypothetical protein VFU72_13520, partial [Nitrolancea sp.]|nr:hypothetical protein [Nitrolancea sp.]